MHAWDVPAALVGVVAALALFTVIGRTSVTALLLLSGGSVYLRRRLFPSLTPVAGANRAPLSSGMRVVAYTCVMVGGITVMAAGLVFALLTRDGNGIDITWPYLVGAAFGAPITAIGVRLIF